MKNVNDILMILFIVVLVIYNIYILFHLDDFRKGLEELDSLKRCMNDPYYERAFFAHHNKLIEEGQFPKRKIPKWKMWWMEFLKRRKRM